MKKGKKSKNKKGSKAANKITGLVLILIFLAGLSLLLYPTVANWWNSRHQSEVIKNYSEAVAELDNEQYEKILSAAEDYNKKLSEKAVSDYILTAEEQAEYNALLNIDGTGVMGYIEIPVINVKLPIYHGTDEAVLAVGVGHIAGSSLPVGGKGSHCVLSGHRGLPSATLFTNLDKLTEGDLFTLNILDEIYTYEVDQIRIVLPQEVSDLEIEEGKDYCTLVTCTPYGINTHRLLVRGHRVENQSDGVRVTSDAIQIEAIYVAPFVAAPILLALLIIMTVKTRKKKGKKSKVPKGGAPPKRL